MTTVDATPPASADGQRWMHVAQVQARLGRTDRALALYEQVLALEPGHTPAFLGAIGLLRTAQDWPGIVAQCDQWLDRFPDHAAHVFTDRVHNYRIGALVRIGGLDLAFATYGLEQASSEPVAIGADEIVVLVGARNEVDRLPYLLDHHRRLGVDRFLVVDNDSDDGSLPFLLEQPDTVVWTARGSFRRANNGAAWADLVLRRHVDGQWCLVLDADELFVYPGFEHRGIRALCEELDRAGATCYPALMLDMYGTGRLSEARYAPGQDPLEVFPFFDADFYRLRIPFDGPRRNMTNYWGGVRARVFGGGLGGYLLNKVPLHRYAPGQLMFSGNHWLDRPTREIAIGRGALLHFKLGASFARDASEEAAREEHARGAWIYKHYTRALAARPDPVLHDDAHSVRFRDSAQLVDLGIMLDSSGERVPFRHRAAIIPTVPPTTEIGPDAVRPHWSVVVRAGPEPDAARTADRIAGVLRALDGEPASEVVLVVTAADHEPLVTLLATGGHEVVAARSEQQLTEIEAANLGLRAARGAWVHVIGSGAPPPPALYSRARATLGDHDVGVLTARGEALRTATDVDFAIPPSAVVARRDRLEAVGGFCAAVSAGAAWELLTRLAHDRPRDPVWLTVADEPIPPASAPSYTAPAAHGENVAQWLRAIDLVAETMDLDGPTVTVLHDRCADRAAAIARDEIDEGRFASALATIGEALRAPVSDGARADLLSTITERLG